MNRLLADDEVGASQESGGGFNSNYIPFSNLGPPREPWGWGEGASGEQGSTGNRVALGTG